MEKGLKKKLGKLIIRVNAWLKLCKSRECGRKNNKVEKQCAYIVLEGFRRIAEAVLNLLRRISTVENAGELGDRPEN